MKYCKIIDGVVTQTQRSVEDGFIECPEHVHCGMIKEGEIYRNPDPIIKTPEEIEAEVLAEAEKELNVPPAVKVVLKQIFLLRKVNESTLTQAEFLTELKEDYKAFKA